jgi:hypothetical protein
LQGGSTNLYAYAAEDPANFQDYDGNAFGNCAQVLAKLRAAEAKLAQRLQEAAACGGPDPGHEKAIEQLQRRVDALRKPQGGFVRSHPLEATPKLVLPVETCPRSSPS